MINNCELTKKISNLTSKKQKFVFAINFDADKGFVLSPEEASKQKVFFDVEGITNFNYDFKTKAEDKKFKLKPISYHDYKKAFDLVQNHIKTGNTYLINLTFKTEIDTDFTFKEIFNHSKASYKLLYKDEFVLFSPECFVKTQGNIIHSFPMKGTIDARIPNAEDLLRNSEKEFCEHVTIVDLIRNDLNIIAQNTKVEQFRYIDKISSNRGELLQVSSVISSELPEDFHDNAGEYLMKLLPAGSISGAPKQKTVEIIKQAENYNRGFYTGIFGYFDGKDFNTAVNIRFLEKEKNSIFYKSGGGITSLSNPESEYEELIKKIYVPVF